jgi:hypothetical protein
VQLTLSLAVTHRGCMNSDVLLRVNLSVGNPFVSMPAELTAGGGGGGGNNYS